MTGKQIIDNMRGVIEIDNNLCLTARDYIKLSRQTGACIGNDNFVNEIVELCKSRVNDERCINKQSYFSIMTEYIDESMIQYWKCLLTEWANAGVIEKQEGLYDALIALDNLGELGIEHLSCFDSNANASIALRYLIGLQ